jgi:hypothetical protein
MLVLLQVVLIWVLSNYCGAVGCGAGSAALAEMTRRGNGGAGLASSISGKQHIMQVVVAVQ